VTVHMDEHLDELYGAPLEQFVSLRNEIARRLRDEGDKDGAAHVSALKKPSVSAWVVNQLSRSHKVELDALIEAGEALEQAQRQSLKGEARSAFDAARRRENEAIVSLRQAAVEGASAVSGGTLERVINTLRAGAASPEGRILLSQGRLTADLESSGFDLFIGALGLPADDQPSDDQPAGKSKAEERRLEALRNKARQAEEAADNAATDARNAEAAADDADKVAKRARKQAVDASRRADAAAEKSRRLSEELAEASGAGR
jgi:hypothetical protein